MSLREDLLFIDRHFSNPDAKLSKEQASELVNRLISAADSLKDLTGSEDLKGLSVEFLKSALGILFMAMMGSIASSPAKNESVDNQISQEDLKRWATS